MPIRQVGRTNLAVVVEQREHVNAGQLLAAFEEVEFNYEGQTGDIAANRFHQLHASSGSAASGEQVVDDDDALPALDGVFVDLKGIGAVFEVVGELGDFRRQFLRLAHGYEAGIQAIGERRAEDEATGFNADDQIDVAIEVVLRECVDECSEADLVFEQGGDVIEQNSLLG